MSALVMGSIVWMEPDDCRQSSNLPPQAIGEVAGWVA